MSFFIHANNKNINKRFKFFNYEFIIKDIIYDICLSKFQNCDNKATNDKVTIILNLLGKSEDIVLSSDDEKNDNHWTLPEYIIYGKKFLIKNKDPNEIYFELGYQKNDSVIKHDYFSVR